ncbi:MAG: hypothetical protein KGL35_32285, partial [Bradyrhizobium sp.]|nr:hypothetical protein [Bradyrhizobium sp.]
MSKNLALLLLGAASVGAAIGAALTTGVALRMHEVAMEEQRRAMIDWGAQHELRLRTLLHETIHQQAEQIGRLQRRLAESEAGAAGS